MFQGCLDLQVHKIIGFYPTVLQIAVNNQLPSPVRQSAAVYIKNACLREWEVSDEKQHLSFTIHENDKSIIRENIIDAVVMSPDNISSVLVVCVNFIAKNDFPHKWSSVVQKIASYLEKDVASMKNALLALYQLIKVFEYKRSDERAGMDEAMKIFIPLMYRVFVGLIPDDSNESLLIQKQILKNFYTNIHYQLNQKLYTQSVLLQWMEVIKSVIERPIPARVLQIDEEDRPDEPAWKCKKWAINVCLRIFDRYGTPASVSKEYKKFADWYINTFSQGIVTALLGVLEQYGNGIYVTPRVINLTISYLNVA